MSGDVCAQCGAALAPDEHDRMRRAKQASDIRTLLAVQRVARDLGLWPPEESS